MVLAGLNGSGFSNECNIALFSNHLAEQTGSQRWILGTQSLCTRCAAGFSPPDAYAISRTHGPRVAKMESKC
jgi:hypothetical protein